MGDGVMERFFDLLWRQPARIVSASFALVATMGAVLLTLPAATVDGRGLAFLDALFTATSAVCVTGLIVVDTASVFTGFGLGVILVLMQLGGLGIMAFTLSTVYLVRRRLTMDEAELLSFMLNQQNRHAVMRQLGVMLLITFGVEAVGAAVLSVAFRPHVETWLRAGWYGIFHAVSAFNNAGFALFSNSLESFVDAALVNWTVMALIVTGGIGFGTLMLLRKADRPTVETGDEPVEMAYQPRMLLVGRGERVLDRLLHPRSLSARVALAGTVLLLAAGTIVFYLAEARNALADMTLPHKYLASLFQSVTLRTAGFNTVSFSEVRRTTLLLVIPFMFIGGASGGTAGGIKIGTVATLYAEFRRFFRHERDAVLYARRLPGRLVSQAIVLVMAGFVVAGVAVVILSYTETAPLEVVLFEVFSALGTVGLSAGLTGDLSGVGRTVVIVLMLVGRLGPLTLFAAFRPEGKPARVRAPKGELPIG